MNTPGNRVVTNNLEDSTLGQSCGSVSCTASNSLASDNNGTFNQFPAGGNVNVSWLQTRTLQPGAYNDLSVGGGGTLVLRPGVYTFSGSFTTAGNSTVRLEGAGGTAVHVNGNVNIGGQVNTAAPTPQLFLFTRGNVSLSGSASMRAYIYARGTVVVQNSGEVRGAITARGNITLGTESILGLFGGATVEYDPSGLANGEFGTFCRSGGAITLSGFSLTVPASGSTCQPVTISISAIDSQGNLMPGYTGSIAIATSTGRGDWSKTGAAADALGLLMAGLSNSGTATYSFEPNGNDAGTVSLRLSNSHAGPLTITINDAEAGATTLSTPVTFSENGFIITSADSLGTDVVVGRSHAYQVQMVRRDPSTGVCGVASNYNRAAVRAWLVRAAGDPGGAAPLLINNSAVATNLPNSMPGSDNLPANFTAGTANLMLSTSDVGRYRLEIADHSGSFSSLPILGNSADITARPFALHVHVENPGASSPTGAVFQPAGQPFSASVRAVAWQAADDNNGDGAADGHADGDASSKANLANNPTVSSFGRETPAAAVILRSALLLPAGGVDPGLGSALVAPADGRRITGFSNGAGSTSNIYFDETGIIELRAKIDGASYLGSVTAIDRTAGRSASIGRFVPGRFSLSAPEVRASCETALPYSYMGEPFSLRFSLTALSARGGITRNYGGAFAKLGASDGMLAVSGRDLSVGVPLQSRLATSGRSFNWAGGIANGEVFIRLDRAATPDGPYTQLRLGLLPTDGDGVSIPVANRNFDGNADGINEAVLMGQTDVRSGRLVLDDAFGPETAILPVGMRTEYWDGSNWRLNRDDSCTTLPLSSIQYPSGPITVAGNRTVPVGAGTTRGEYASISPAGVKFTAGDAGHYFTAPGAANTGSFRVNILLQDHPWLSFDWNGNLDHSDPTAPSATYTFGVYRGHDRIIHWREILR